MVYLAVDKDGTELIFDTKPMRRKKLDGARLMGIVGGGTKVSYSKNDWNKWYNGWSSDSSNALPQNGIILSKGSIEKLIGLKLTWQDEPYKY